MPSPRAPAPLPLGELSAVVSLEGSERGSSTLPYDYAPALGPAQLYLGDNYLLGLTAWPLPHEHTGASTYSTDTPVFIPTSDQEPCRWGLKDYDSPELCEPGE